MNAPADRLPVIDGWVNVSMGDSKPPEYLVRVKEDYLKQGDSFFRSYDPPELLDLMDSLGVAKSVIAYATRGHGRGSNDSGSGRVLRFVDEHPDRFALAVHVDPRGLMKELWALEDIVRDHPVACARVVPFGIDLAPSDALYYPLYAKCVEIDLPLTINAGLPGPPMPGECQDPIHLDRVCHRFPDLKLCMAHGADPWWGVAIRLMIKYRNLHLMTSAWSPKRFPAELLHFMRTRGADKIIFASDHPALPMQRCVDEARALDLPEDILAKYLYTNADRFFFAPRSPRY